MTTAQHILIPDFGIGNIASIIRMSEKAGHTCRIARSPEEISSADKLVLAGVGAFDHGMQSILDGGWYDALQEQVVVRGKPTLGICLGMQLMCLRSEEGTLPGLGWIDADVVRFPSPEQTGLRVPHMGWNTVSIQRASALIPPTNEELRFYFVHSYRVRCHQDENILTSTHYGCNFVSSFNKDNIFGVQFHPEKSHRFGMQLLNRFMEI
ncbi:imidazole glycerol phosphate synthase subunit HisH [Neisseriaceae bacterium JH1-16]|nr:imidazole glycerol phosphate synthase subunit HisH [Neisseriaceae bacterium JH1-16]